MHIETVAIPSVFGEICIVRTARPAPDCPATNPNPTILMKKLALPIVLAAFAAVMIPNAHSAVVVNGANAVTWYDINTNSGSGSSLSGSALNITSSTATDASNIVTGYFTSQNLGLLANDSYISLTFSITVGSVADQNNNFRFGLFNSNGLQLTADAAGNNPPNARNALGYIYRIATDPSSTSGNISRYYSTSGGGSATALTSNNGVQTQLGVDVGTGTILSSTTRNLEFRITKTNATDVLLGAYIDGNLLGSGRAVTGANMVFDQMAFSMGNTNSTGYSIDNLQVSVVPEPATWALLAGSLTAVMVFRRRRAV